MLTLLEQVRIITFILDRLMDDFENYMDNYGNYVDYYDYCIDHNLDPEDELSKIDYMESNG